MNKEPKDTAQNKKGKQRSFDNPLDFQIDNQKRNGGLQQPHLIKAADFDTDDDLNKVETDPSWKTIESGQKQVIEKRNTPPNVQAKERPRGKVVDNNPFRSTPGE